MEVRKSSSAVTSTVSNRLRFQLRLNAQARQSLGAEDAAETTTMTTATPPAASGKNKRKSQSDPSYNPAGVKQRAVGADVSGEGTGIATSRNRRKGGRTPKYRESYVHYENGASGDDDENDNDGEVTDGGGGVGGDHVKREVDHVTEMLIKKDEDGAGDARLLNTDQGSVRVKEEPVDAGYEKASDSHTLSSPSASASSSSNAVLVPDIKPYSSSSSTSCANLLRNCPSPNSKSVAAAATTKTSSSTTKTAITSNSNTTVREVAKSLKDSKPHGGRVSPLGGGSSSTSGQTINSVADLLSTRRELSETCTRLIETQTQNINLETRLEDAHKELVYLRDTLRTRELQITNLANSFFDLSNQFMRASNEFKQVMQSIQPSGEQYVPPQL